jgi:hypothetical protein
MLLAHHLIEGFGPHSGGKRLGTLAVGFFGL